MDVDGDGSRSCADCDDADGANFPGNPEACDGQDNDCNTLADFDVAGEVDGDGDASLSCEDCDDADPLNTPGAPELCDDLDNDCSTVADDYLATSYFASPGAPVGPGGGTVTVDTIVIADAGVVADLNVTLDITHTWVGDLDIDITSPAGTTVRVFDEGQLGDADDMVNTVFDDEGANLPIASNLDAPFTGSWLPFEPLGAFDGEPIAGTWTITVTDVNDDDGGTLNAWSLDFFPDGYGDQPECGALSCDEVVTLDPSAPDASYYLDPLLTGTGSLHECDQTTDGGGWTKVYGWNRIDDNDTTSDFTSSWTQLYEANMTVLTTVSNYIHWQDWNANRDYLDGIATVDVPNGGEYLHDIHFQGVSMEQSAVWFGVGTANGEEELWCNDDISGSAGYSASDLARIPYTCNTSSVPNLTYSPGLVQGTATTEIDNVFLVGLNADQSGGDDCRLFHYEVWVR